MHIALVNTSRFMLVVNKERKKYALRLSLRVVFFNLPDGRTEK